MMEQLARIRDMERALDAGTAAVAVLAQALETYCARQPQLQALFDYYGSPAWWQDYDDDRAGRLPAELKRGVLSEDAVYDLLTEQQRLMDIMRTLAAQKTE